MKRYGVRIEIFEFGAFKKRIDTFKETPDNIHISRAVIEKYIPKRPIIKR